MWLGKKKANEPDNEGGAGAGLADNESGEPLNSTSNEETPGNASGSSNAGGKRAAIGAAFSSAGAAIGGRGQNIRTGAQSKLQAAHESIQNGDYKRLHESLGTYVKSKVDVDVMQAAGFGDIGAKLAERRRNAQEALINLSAPLRAKVLFALRENIKAAALADKDMPMCLKRNLAGGIDLLWADIMVYVETSIEDVKEVVKGQRITDIEELGRLGIEDKPACCTPRWFRAFLLYKFLPYDMSIFGQMKDFWFWVFTLLSMLPSVRVGFFLVLLIAECSSWPPDEFQLVQFILMFKGCQFLSSGVCMACFVAVKYFLCVHPDGAHTCETNGPAASHNEISSIVDIFGSCILVWTVFWILPSSIRSAGEREVVKEEDKDDEDGEDAQKRCGCCRYDPKRGGRLQGLLRYDLVCFIISLLFFCLLMLINTAHLKPGEREETKFDQEEIKAELETYYFSYDFRVSIYWTRIFYSLLSAPFFLFYLPVLNGILTHTSFTGYNKQGVCVPFMMPPDDSPIPGPEDDKEA